MGTISDEDLNYLYTRLRELDARKEALLAANGVPKDADLPVIVDSPEARKLEADYKEYRRREAEILTTVD